MINYPNLPNSTLEITQQPEVKEITNELIKNFQAPHSTLMRRCPIGRVPMVVLKRTILKKLE
ncbi:hypothetical protein ACOWKX_08075, partial [Helicobacter pylori]